MTLIWETVIERVKWYGARLIFVGIERRAREGIGGESRVRNEMVCVKGNSSIRIDLILSARLEMFL